MDLAFYVEVHVVFRAVISVLIIALQCIHVPKLKYCSCSHCTTCTPNNNCSFFFNAVVDEVVHDSSDEHRYVHISNLLVNILTLN